jgi:hypothetical protein
LEELERGLGEFERGLGEFAEPDWKPLARNLKV